MARLLRRNNADDLVPVRSSSSRTPVVNFSPQLGDWNSRDHETSKHSSTALHSPSSWQRAQKIQKQKTHLNQSPSKQCNHLVGVPTATAYDFNSEPLASSDLPATPNASLHLQRALTPKQPSILSRNVLPTPTSSRPSTSAGSSLPPRGISSREVPSVEYFAASEATVLRRSSENQRGLQTGYGGGGSTRSVAVTSKDAVMQLAASVLDSSHNHSSVRANPVIAGLQQELSKLQAHRSMELDRMKACLQRPPANFLMRQRNLPESLPSEHGTLELSLRNRCGSMPVSSFVCV